MSYLPSETRYKHMPYVQCGRSGLSLPRISLGLWHNFGACSLHETSRDMLLTAFDLGVTHFDLANNYGPPPGAAEETLRRILHSDLGAYRDELIISTKAGYRMWPGPYGDRGSRKYMLASLDQSLTRMGLDYVDIFYSHRVDSETPLEETMGALDTAVRQGKALYVGISSYPPEQTRRAAAVLKSLGTPCLIHQPSYSMFNRSAEDGLLDVLEEEGMGAIAFCPLAQGLLTSRYLQGIPEGSRAATEGTFLKRERIKPALVETLTALNSIAEQRGQSLAQMALTWVLRDPRITSALIGASRAGQIRENVGAASAPALTEAELKAIDEILASAPRG